MSTASTSPLGLPDRPFIGQAVYRTSGLDDRVKLHIDPDHFDFWIEYPTYMAEAFGPLTPSGTDLKTKEAVRLMLLLAQRRGYLPLEECEDELVGETWRCYLRTWETICDTNLEETLPKLEETSQGPHSGFMESV